MWGRGGKGRGKGEGVHLEDGFLVVNVTLGGKGFGKKKEFTLFHIMITN